MELKQILFEMEDPGANYFEEGKVERDMARIGIRLIARDGTERRHGFRVVSTDNKDILRVFQSMRDFIERVIQEEERAEKESSRGKFLPCPFCGGLDVDAENAYGAKGEIIKIIFCKTCSAHNKADDWNKRATAK